METSATAQLDPQARAFLDALIAAKVPSIASLTPPQARERMILLSNFAGLPAVERVEERQIPGPGGPIALRAYMPAGTGDLPALAYFHGGGFVTGNFDTHDSLCRRLAAALKGVVVAVDYRLAPEHPYPAAVDDAWAAVQWLSEQAAQLGATSGSVLVGGDSAGGCLAAAVSFRARTTRQARIAGQLLLYPVLTHHLTSNSYRQFAEGYLLTREAMAWFWRHYVPNEIDRSHPEASPLCAPDLANLPPAVVVTAGFDPLRDEGREYAARLQAAGTSARLLEYPTQVHDFLRRAHLFDVARAAFPEIATALRETVTRTRPDASAGHG